MLLKILNVAFDKSARARFANVGPALSDFAATELTYTSAVVQTALSASLIIALAGFVLGAVLFAFLVGLLLAGFFLLPDALGISQGTSVAIMLVVFALTGGGIGFFLYSKVETLTEIVKQYFQHWKVTNETEYPN